MNLRLVFRVQGILLLMLAIAMGCCLVFAILDFRQRGEVENAWGFFRAVLLTGGTGALLVWWGRHAGTRVLRREAVAIVGLGWLVCSLFGSLPYMMGNPVLAPGSAYFEAMSGFTTTGSTVITDLDLYPRSQLLWRALTQWLGGMGILVLFVALLAYFGVGSKGFFRHESSAHFGQGFQSRIKDTAMILWKIYIGLSVVCALGLWLLGMTPFESIIHAFTTISTGGFSSRDSSIAEFNSPAIELWVTLFMLLGGTSFVLFAWLLRRRWDRWKVEEETKIFLGIVAVSVLVITWDVLRAAPGAPFWDTVRGVLFTVSSIITTTGFCTADFDLWPSFSKAWLIVLMIIGGCAGSTAGGIKVSRVILYWKMGRQQLINTFRPNQVLPLRMNGDPVQDEFRQQTLAFAVFILLVLAVSPLVVTFLEPNIDLITAFSAVVTTLFNVGPGLAEVGASRNFAGLGEATLVFLSLLMALGRLELFAILVLFMPELWRRY